MSDGVATSFDRIAALHSALEAPAAAVLAFVALRLSRPSALLAPSLATTLSPTPAAGPRQLTLSDGTVVQLNTGGELIEQFTSAERRVRLARGEAHFAVTKNPARPFVVRAGNVDVRAVGTAFNVNLQSAAVDVLVTEGKVSVSEVERVDPNALQRLAVKPLHLVANERAVVSRAPSPTSAASPSPTVVVTTAGADEIALALAWHAPLLRLGGSTLAELAVEFERRSGQRVILADPAAASLRVGGRFRADDLAGFTHLLATTLDLDAERNADDTLVLRKKIQSRDSGIAQPARLPRAVGLRADGKTPSLAPLYRLVGWFHRLLLTLTLILFFALPPLHLGGAETTRRPLALPEAAAAVTLEMFSDPGGAPLVDLIDDARGGLTHPVQGNFAIPEALARRVARTALRVDLEGKPVPSSSDANLRRAK